MKFEIVVCKLFQFGGVQNLLFAKGLEKWQTHVIFRSSLILVLILSEHEGYSSEHWGW